MDAQIESVSRTHEKVEELLDRDLFNSHVYMDWHDAVAELERRQADPAIVARVDELLGREVPIPMKGKKNMVLFRHIATPNYEVSRFLSAADALTELNPLILEYTADKFNNRNEWKFSLAKLRFHHGLNKLGEQIFDTKTVIDINAGNNQPLKDIKTHAGTSLVDTHHKLFADRFPQFTESTYDLSEWLHAIGPQAQDYYKSFFALFLKDGILFENFMVDGKEMEFTKNIILPALIELEQETGLRPLIVPLEPTHIEGDKFWLSYPPEIKVKIEKEIGG